MAKVRGAESKISRASRVTLETKVTSSGGVLMARSALGATSFPELEAQRSLGVTAALGL